MKTIKIGLVGLGVVGGGTVSVLAKNTTEISRRCGYKIEVVAIAVRDLSKSRSVNIADDVLLTDSIEQVVTHPEVDILVELIGGTDAALSVVLQALDAGKHVVTANKALIATHGKEIFARALERQKTVRFEAAVAGGIPIIKAIREGVSANNIKYLYGIVNGTSNFILSAMQSAGSSFSAVLKQAQELGYAEADPTFDVEGVDAAHKLAILSAVAFGSLPQFEQIYREGITEISPEDVSYAQQLGYVIKHIGIAKKANEGVEMRVHPALIPAEKLMANVDGVMNAVAVTGNAVGESFYYGSGAGAEPTASAVIADIIDVSREMAMEPTARVPLFAFQPGALVEYPVLPIQQVRTAYYLRIKIKAQADMAIIHAAFDKHHTKIQKLVEIGASEDGQYKTIVLLTEESTELVLSNTLQTLCASPDIDKDVVRIYVEHFS